MSGGKLSVPYLCKLDGNLQPGQTLVIKGLVTGLTHFDVNLLSGSRVEADDIPLHLGFKQKERTIVINSFKQGKWEKEEKKKNPFKEHEPFDLRIRALDTKFKIFCNHKDLCELEYRQPLNNINHVYINGEVELHAVNWGGKYYPVPYEVGVEGGLTPGKRLQLSGLPEKKAKRFHVNLVSAKGGDVALHFDVRFDEKCVVRNSQMRGAWQQEEREGKMPFERDQVFDLTIANESYAFQVSVNGNHFCSFAHRVDPHNVRGLEIGGDVELQGVYVK